MNANDLVNNMRIAKPCPASWEDMRGDERKRFCSMCQKHVYNFAAMTAEEGAALIRETEGRLCGRLYRRRDGMVLTADCPVGVALFWRKTKMALAAAAAVTVFAVGSALAVGQARGDSPQVLRSQYAAAIDEAIWKVKAWFGIYRPAIAGEIQPINCKLSQPTQQSQKQ